MRPTADPRNLIRFIPAKGVDDAASVPPNGGSSILEADQPQAIIVGAGEVDDTALAGLLVRPARSILIAADGGAEALLRAGRDPDVVVGDFDSLAGPARRQLQAAGVPMRRAPSDKDESDMELALLAAVEAGVRHAHILGAFGPLRPEHTVANLWLLADPRFAAVELEIHAGGSTITRIGDTEGPGHASLAGRPGDYISLFPLGETVTGVRTSGLRFALEDEVLPMGPARGLSNELVGSSASVETHRGRLLVIHTPRDIEDRTEDLA